MSAWKPSGPFCWQPKEAFRIIEENLEQPSTAAMVYVGLTRIASNVEGPSFSKPIGYIAKLAMVDRRTVLRRIPDLERLGLVKVDRRRIPDTNANDLSTYTLTTLSHKVVTPSHQPPGDTVSQAGDTHSGHKVTVSEETKKGEKGKGAKGPFVCDECEEKFDDAGEAEPLYECDECCTKFTPSSSPNGNHKCECGKFARKVSDLGCPSCNEGELEEVTEVTPKPKLDFDAAHRGCL